MYLSSTDENFCFNHENVRGFKIIVSICLCINMPQSPLFPNQTIDLLIHESAYIFLNSEFTYYIIFVNTCVKITLASLK